MHLKYESCHIKSVNIDYTGARAGNGFLACAMQCLKEEGATPCQDGMN